MKPYCAEIHITEDDHEWKEFDTLDEAVDWLKTLSASWHMCRGWINNREVNVKSGAVLGNDGSAFCINQVWHDLFADRDYPKIEVRV